MYTWELESLKCDTLTYNIGGSFIIKKSKERYKYNQILSQNPDN